MTGSSYWTRTAYAEIPPRVEYALTELGSSLRPVLDSLAEWGSGYKEYVAERTDNPSNS
ncbi:winged helix-turn-helix transcriptional regulator [Methanomethylophilus alvi]|uniref:winged helix-turn-helix transcriptional regulator n=1 Tax=Methanomethylophilus alvi TaxID=1291540 RepID=UPI0037DCB931